MVFTLKIDTIGNELLEYPIYMDFPCDEVIPVDVQVMRDFDTMVENIVATSVFLFRCGSQLFGTTDFKSASEFNDFRGGKCGCCECGFMVNGCFLTFNGCTLNLS